MLNMMTAPGAVALAERLEKLTGTPAEECVPLYQKVAASISKSSRFREASLRFMAVADPKRLLVIALLGKQGPVCACEIQAAMGVSHPVVSYHMAALTRAGLVEGERDGKWVRYRLTEDGRKFVP